MLPHNLHTVTCNRCCWFSRQRKHVGSRFSTALLKTQVRGLVKCSFLRFWLGGHGHTFLWKEASTQLLDSHIRSPSPFHIPFHAYCVFIPNRSAVGFPCPSLYITIQLWLLPLLIFMYYILWHMVDGYTYPLHPSLSSPSGSNLWIVVAIERYWTCDCSPVYHLVPLLCVQTGSGCWRQHFSNPFPPEMKTTRDEVSCWVCFSKCPISGGCYQGVGLLTNY